MRVARYRVVVRIALYDRLEPLPGFRHRFVHSLPELLLDFRQLSPHGLAYRVSLYRKEERMSRLHPTGSRSDRHFPLSPDFHFCDLLDNGLMHSTP